MNRNCITQARIPTLIAMALTVNHSVRAQVTIGPTNQQEANQNKKSDKVQSGDICGPDKTLVDSSKVLAGNIVTLRVLISPRGRVIIAEPVSGDPALYGRAKRAVGKMKLKPQKILGHSVETEILMRLAFSGDRKSPELIR